MKPTQALHRHAMPLAFLALVCVTACRPEAAPSPPPVASPTPPAVPAPAAPEPAIPTPAEPTVLDASKSHVWFVAAPTGPDLEFVIVAGPDRPLFLDNCGGAIGWGLERERAGKWEFVWGPPIPECHSAPIEIAPGQHLSFRRRLDIPADEAIPAGRYRLAVNGLYRSHDSVDHSRSVPVPDDMRGTTTFVPEFVTQPQ